MSISKILAGHESYVFTVSKVFAYGVNDIFYLPRRRTCIGNSVTSFTHEFNAQEGKKIVYSPGQNKECPKSQLTCAWSHSHFKKSKDLSLHEQQI